MGVCARTERVLQIKNQDFGVALGHDVIVAQKIFTLEKALVVRNDRCERILRRPL